MAEVIELQKLKLAELRQECEARGLETKGNKGELIARLQAYLDEHEDDVDVDDVLAEESGDFSKVESTNNANVNKNSDVTESEEPAEKKVVKITPPSSSSERLQKRAERFNMPASSESKKALRAARFGLPTDASSPSPGQVANSKTVKVNGVGPGQYQDARPPGTSKMEELMVQFDSLTSVNMDLLKKRAERFGMNVSSVSQKIEEDEKLKKRKERFGILTSAGTAAADDMEAKKMKRAERFGKV